MTAAARRRSTRSLSGAGCIAAECIDNTRRDGADSGTRAGCYWQGQTERRDELEEHGAPSWSMFVRWLLGQGAWTEQRSGPTRVPVGCEPPLSSRQAYV